MPAGVDLRVCFITGQSSRAKSAEGREVEGSAVPGRQNDGETFGIGMQEQRGKEPHKPCAKTCQ
jgi:hypothetical protein